MNDDILKDLVFIPSPDKVYTYRRNGGNMNTVEKIEEVTMFKASDGTCYPTMDEACDYQEALEFRQWCEKNICVGGEWSAQMVATEILRYWNVKPRYE